MSNIPNLIIFLCGVILFGHAQAEAHKCIAIDGKISYQDVPCQGQDKRISATATSDAVSPLTRREKQKRILEQALKDADQARSAPPIVLPSASDRAAKKLANTIGKPRIGMNESAVRSGTWGEPSSINRTTTSYGITEQWVYYVKGSQRYVYLTNGIVTAIQE